MTRENAMKGTLFCVMLWLFLKKIVKGFSSSIKNRQHYMAVQQESCVYSSYF